MMIHILLDTNDYIDLCIITQLVHDFHLKSVKGHLVNLIMRNSYVKYFSFYLILSRLK
jgi:hypothetical protein